MSKLTYNFGFALGVVAREFWRAMKKSNIRPADQAQAKSHGLLPPPCVPDSMVREMDHLPAMVRAKGVDLNLWYAANTRVIEKTTRKPRSRGKAQQLTPAAC
ncbi:hypothetical protein [Pseudomonas sp. Larv2_ips]|uniref:hypothetical protein n=1 Tax=Pseudomonas sp. Larv2_ips TaxID=1896942 RepID=UPI000E6D4EFC|nr:hypothetical protein [Pseudomonas sp. Larv2_ips]